MNICIPIIVTLAVLAGCTSAEAPVPPAVAADAVARDAGAANLPADAALVIDRLSSCNHFAGEFNGDGSERDREVNATMTELGCATIADDVGSLRAKYADNAVVQDALAAAEAY